jgi:hypothetical protein
MPVLQTTIHLQWISKLLFYFFLQNSISLMKTAHQPASRVFSEKTVMVEPQKVVV